MLLSGFQRILKQDVNFSGFFKLKFFHINSQPAFREIKINCLILRISCSIPDGRRKGRDLSQKASQILPSQ